MSQNNDLSRPVNVISIILAVVSIALSIFFYFRSQRDIVPTFNVSAPSIKIFDSKMSSPQITLHDSSGNIIAEDVYLLETIFWNAGQLPAEPEMVRTPIRLTVSKCNRILDFKIVNQTNPDIAGIRIYRDTSFHSTVFEQSLVVNWRHLDPGFGFKLQVVYIGAPDADINYSGYIVGVNSIVKALPPGKSNPITALLTISLGIVVGMLLPIFVIGLSWLIKRNPLDKPIWKINRIMFFLIVVVILIFLRYVVFAIPIPPF